LLPGGARVRADRDSGPWAAWNIMRARCGHCGARTSNQMLRRMLSTAERTMTPVRQQKDERNYLAGCKFQAPQKCLRLMSAYAINFMP
jgi:hypothetical protein